MKIINLLLCSFLLITVHFAGKRAANDLIIAKGRMPNIAKDKNNNIHVVYGTGDSIMYVFSKNGQAFTPPALVAVLPGLFATAMRGPQIAATDEGVIVSACNHKGNIYSFKKEASGRWTKALKINDQPETAKEALMALSADGMNGYAVWLGVKSPKGQNVYGARSVDGGKSWSKNILVYSAPDSTVCECCKPSVVVKGNSVHVMFRNWLNGGRDLFLIKSVNGGVSFEPAKKLGNGSWKLNGCPMDGGGLAIDRSGAAETVWRREGRIYASSPGTPEKELGEGRGCSIETVNDKKVYAWTENGNVVVMKPQGVKKDLGKGTLPLLKALNNEHVICVWENEQQIHSAIVEL